MRLGIVLLLGIAALVRTASAGTLDRVALEQIFPPPFIVGEREEKPPLWPIFKHDMTSDVLVAYVFESVDLAPVPGFSGTPPNLLVALKPDGSFLAVRVLSQHEPVFVGGLGTEPLDRFVDQYARLSLKRSWRVDSAAKARNSGGGPDAIDGVAKATASVRIINESITAAALKVARAKLGYATGADPALQIRPRLGAFTAKNWVELGASGLVSHFLVLNAEVETAFRGSIVEGLDQDGLANPDTPFIDIYFGALELPVVGRNLLGDKVFDKLTEKLAGAHAIFVLSVGRWNPFDEPFVRGSVPERIFLDQDGLSFEIRDLDLEDEPVLAGIPAGTFKSLKIFEQAGFDPSRSWSLGARVTRSKGQVFPERIIRTFQASYSPPAGLFDRREPAPSNALTAILASRATDLAIIGAALAVLALALWRQHLLTSDVRRLTVFRMVFLTITLCFIGFYAQAQLSIVSVIGIVKATASDHDFTFLLYDPASLLVWSFSLVAALTWGRGTFCGWVCPFGALQELARLPRDLLGYPEFHLPARVDRPLRLLKYGVLVGVLATALVRPDLAERVAEVEPFKTAITLGFARSWPFVAYALGLIVLNLFVHKAFCRYLCPLGAAFAILGRLRRFDWIARRAECGTACQRCRMKCKYGAIERTGQIDYDECFQCLDCVALYENPRKCFALVRAAERAKALGVSIRSPVGPNT
jgi:NosR/NirI family nitrous oxide reductase transcriptional regulator